MLHKQNLGQKENNAIFRSRFIYGIYFKLSINARYKSEKSSIIKKHRPITKQGSFFHKLIQISCSFLDDTTYDANHKCIVINL